MAKNAWALENEGYEMTAGAVYFAVYDSLSERPFTNVASPPFTNISFTIRRERERERRGESESLKS